MKKVHMVLVDLQNDFCDPKGSLYVPGADKAAKATGEFISKNKHLIEDIHATLDSHHQLDIAHPMFWIDMTTMKPVNPFTVITHQDLLDGKYRTKVPAFMNPTSNFIGALEYTKQLEQNGRYALCIWPPHCDIASWGYGLHEDVYKALVEWEVSNFGLVNKICKGSNWTTEHYSFLQADVSDPNDIEGTGYNMKFIKMIQDADEVIITGVALDFCVANSVRDIATGLGEENIKKLVLFEDCTAAVNSPGLEHLGPDFIKEMTGRGMRVMKSTDYVFV